MEHNVAKVHSVGFNAIAELIAVQGHPRSSILVSIKSSYATSV